MNTCVHSAPISRHMLIPADTHIQKCGHTQAWAFIYMHTHIHACKYRHVYTQAVTLIQMHTGAFSDVITHRHTHSFMQAHT